MKVCNYCGELKPCLKKRYSPPFLMGGYSGIIFEWICKECFKAGEIRFKLEKERERKEKEKNRKKWIKERDKLLRNNKIKEKQQ